MKALVSILILGAMPLISGTTLAGNSENGPYSRDISNYPKEWKGRTFDCSKIDKKFYWVPEFTLAPYSDPNNSELEELCSCIDKDSSSWVKETGEKMKNREEVSWMTGEGSLQALADR